ncbi:MAG: hypothetical protein JNK15_09310, partial [Planctomycetes bacterium]|nr:hypothetical protein [Planctomycetota bacterium]
IELWNGTNWQLIGVPQATVVGQEVRAMAAHGGRLFVGGTFSGIGTTTANGLASYDGSAWSMVGPGLFGDVHALAGFDGKLFVGGWLSVAGIAGNHLVAWDGTAWSSTPGTNGTVTAMSVQPSFFSSGILYVGGEFTTFGSFAAARVARFNAAVGTWSAVGAGLPGWRCAAMQTNTSLLNGTDLVVAVQDPTNGHSTWRWNGTAWSSLPLTDPSTTAMPTCVGWFGGPILGLAWADRALRQYTNSVWRPLRQSGVPDDVLAVDANGGDVVIGGAFATASGVTVNGIARGTHGAWQALGTGLNAGAIVYAVKRAADGTVYAGGIFNTAGGAGASNIARWNGAAWAPLGSGTNGAVLAIHVLADGTVVAGGTFTTAGGVACNRIARWNGASWSPVGSGLGGTCLALAELPGGVLVAGGTFLTAGGVAANRIARWNGVQWQPLGAGVDDAVYSLAVRADGSLAVGGSFLNAGGASAPYVAQWNGSTWASLWVVLAHPLGTVTALTAMPDGSLVAGGGLWSHNPGWPLPSYHTNVMRLVGTTWNPIDVVGSWVNAAAVAPDGDLLVVGDFAETDGSYHANVARLESTCPASAVAYGAGCVGSGGLNVLAATALPWLNGTYRGRATGMPNTGFVAVVTGFQGLALPIAAVLPQGLPGCSVLVTPDLIDVAFAVGGQVTTAVPIPGSPNLVGVQLRQQVAPFETNGAGTLTAISSSNALLLTIGSL